MARGLIEALEDGPVLVQHIPHGTHLPEGWEWALHPSENAHHGRHSTMAWRPVMYDLPDWNFIREQEGFSPTGYVPMTADRQEPLGQSGVTIGSGVDLGHWSVDQLKRRRVPQHIIDQVKPYLRLRGWAAVQKLEADPLTMSDEEAEFLTKCIQGDITEALEKRYEAAAKAAGSLRWEALPGPCKTVILSVGYQYGPMLSFRTPNFWKQVTTGQWGAAYENLMNFGDSYTSRRRREAEVLSRVLVPS